MKGFSRFAALFAAAALAVTAVPVVDTLSAPVYAATVADGYFYQQLTSEAKVFYNAMEQMDREGVFVSGGSFDLVANGLLTSEQAEAYGYSGLMAQYGAARDAFYADSTDLFYVDFDYLTLRVTSDSEGKYHVYLGTGRSDSYYTKGFENEEQVKDAIAEYESEINKIVSGAQTVTAKDGNSRNAEMVKYVHDYIIDHTSYRLENVCKPENIGFIHTAYGSVVKGEAVCEGYSRAVKAVLDRLGIPCVLVYGFYMHDKDTPELHMWCEVQLEGDWYAVDATMDDPRSRTGTTQGIDGWENQDYLLVGSSCMDRQHYSSGIMSPVEYEFEYPPLSVDGYNVEVVGSYGGLTVKFKADGELEDTEAGIFYISYNGMGYAKSAEKGRYLIAKMSQYYERTDEWIIGEWGYLAPEIYSAFEDFDTELRIPAPHVQYLEFAVTDVPPPEYDPLNPDYTFHGDITKFPAYSGVIYNPVGNYVKPPYVKNVTPGVTSMIEVEKTHHVVIEYDDVLELADEDAVPGITFTAQNAVQNGAPCSAERFAKVRNFKWDGVSTVEFDFVPSQMWLDDSVYYIFYVTGLVGEMSGKAPNPISYCTRFTPCSSCAYWFQGYDWTLYAKPTLMDNFSPDNFDPAGWETADGEALAKELVSRMVLVVSTPPDSQTEEMKGMVGGEVLETFNINLTVCKAQVIKTGQKVRVHLGFPEGYGPNDEGVTFKAYHFSKDDDGNIIGVNEIECYVTRQGLVILCDSFSPYAIVAVPAEEDENAAKSVLLTVPEAGTVTGADNIFKLEEGETKTFTVSADDGYVIDSIVVMGKNVKITDSKSMEVTVGYEDIGTLSGTIDVKFVAETVYQAEQDRGETVVVDEPDAEDEPEQQPSGGEQDNGDDDDSGNSGNNGGYIVNTGVSSDNGSNDDGKNDDVSSGENDNSTDESGQTVLTDEETGVQVIGTAETLSDWILLNVAADVTNQAEGRLEYDITLTDIYGSAIQPNGAVTVKIPVPESWGADVPEAYVLKAYRVEADSTNTDMNAVYENGYVVFTTDHFSTYVILREALFDKEEVVPSDGNDRNLATGVVLTAVPFVAVAASLVIFKKRK